MPPHFMLILVLVQGPKSVDALTQRAMEDYRRGNFLAARNELRQALKEAPQSDTLWRYLGQTEAQLDDIDSAITDFQKSLSLAPMNAETHFNLGLLFRRKGETKDALEMYRRGLALDANDAGANQSYASLLLESGRYREAVPPLQRLRKMNGSPPSVRVLLIECYLRSGMRELAEKEIQDLLDSPKASTADHFKLVKVLLENHELNLAQKVLTHAVLVTPDSAEAHAKLGLLLANRNQYEDAAQELEHAVRLAPDSVEYSMELTGVLLLWQHYSSALEFLTAVKGRFEELPDYQYKVALAYYGLNLYPEAITRLDELARQHPEMDLAQYFLGNSYMAEGELNKAEPYYRKAIAINPKNPLYYKSLGELLRRQGSSRMDEAVKALSTALVLDAGDVQAKLGLALCYEKKKNYAQAQSLLEEVVQREPSLLPAHVALARAYYRQKKKPEGDRQAAIISRLRSEEQAKLAQPPNNK